MAKTKAINSIEASLNTPSVSHFTDSTDRQVGDPLLAIKKMLRKELQPDHLKPIASKEHSGKVMRIVKDVLLADNGRWHQKTNGSSEVAPRHTIFYVYVPEIHGLILPTPKSYNDLIIDFLPQFVGVPGIELPSLGAIVDVEFKDSENFDQGIYIGISKDKPIAPWTPPEEEQIKDSFGAECIGRCRALYQSDTKPKPKLAPMGDANPGSRAPIFMPASIANASLEVQNLGIKGKGLFIENVSQETLGAPIEAAEKALEMGLSWVVMRAMDQNPFPEDANPQKSFFIANKQMHGQKNTAGHSALLDRDTIKKYSDEFIKKGILVYLSGRPWNGMESHDYASPGTPVLGFVDYMISAAKYVNAVGVIVDAGPGYTVLNSTYPLGGTITSLSVQNSSQEFILKAKAAGLHIGLSAPAFNDLGPGIGIPWGSLNGYDFYVPKTRMPRPEFESIPYLAYGAAYFAKSMEHYQTEYPGKQIIFCLGASGTGYDTQLFRTSSPAWIEKAIDDGLIEEGDEQTIDYYNSFGSTTEFTSAGGDYNTVKKPPERMREEATWAGTADGSHQSEAVIWWDWKNLNDMDTYNEESIYQGAWSNGPEGAKSRWDVVKSFGYFAEVESILLQTDGIKFIPLTTKVSGKTYKNWSWTKSFGAAETTAGLDEE